jgi:glycosyltransferase involved in cell wall biosynthesis
VRVLFGVHHPLDPRLGAPGASISVGRELQLNGHTVEFFGYDQAFPGLKRFSARHQLAFPWKLAIYLRRHSRRFDVLDITTGDAYLWARLGRPGALPDIAIVTRSNGMEHLAHLARVREASRGRCELSWRYPIYNGGFRLWEVGQSVRVADAVLVLTEDEREFVVERLHAKAEAVRVVPHGLDDSLLAAPSFAERRQSDDQAVRLCFIGNWIDRKGILDVVRSVELLLSHGTRFDLLVAGAGRQKEDVLAAFPTEAKGNIRVVERYHREDLAQLLADRDILVFPSFYEGFGLAVLEAMACGVVPVTTRVGVVPSLVESEVNGFVVPAGWPQDIVNAIEALAADRKRLEQMRLAAHEAARRFTWRQTAQETLALYELARRRRLERLGRAHS